MRKKYFGSMKIDTNQNSKRVNWATQIKRMLDNYTGFGYIWEQQRVNHNEQYIAKFMSRSQDLYIQECFSQIEKSIRCRIYRNVKEVFEIEWYLQENFNLELRKCRLNSHKLHNEIESWMKPIIELNDRICTLCNAKDIEDEYHVLMICSHYKTLHMKFVKKFYYQRPSVYIYHKLLKTTNKRDAHRLRTFIKLAFKDCNCLLTCS